MRLNNCFVIYNRCNSVSVEYGLEALMSCYENGMTSPYLWNGVYNQSGRKLWKEMGLKSVPTCSDKAASISYNHFRIWEELSKYQNPAVILEHDSIILERPDFEMEDGIIYVLGYKFEDIEELFDRSKKPQESIDIQSHEGAHAYAITPKTAQLLLEELRTKNPTIAIDDYLFIRLIKEQSSEIPLKIVSPTPAVGWVRESTIWKKSSTKNAKIVADIK